MQASNLVNTEQTNDNNQKLQTIVMKINNHLFELSHRPLFFSLGKPYFHRCCRSWAKVKYRLENFLDDPRTHYSSLMTVLEYESKKFSERSFYKQALKALSQFIAEGPTFNVAELRKSNNKKPTAPY